MRQASRKCGKNFVMEVSFLKSAPGRALTLEIRKSAGIILPRKENCYGTSSPSTVAQMHPSAANLTGRNFQLAAGPVPSLGEQTAAVV
jgi:hypothetical protein